MHSLHLYSGARYTKHYPKLFYLTLVSRRSFSNQCNTLFGLFCISVDHSFSTKILDTIVLTFTFVEIPLCNYCNLYEY